MGRRGRVIGYALVALVASGAAAHAADWPPAGERRASFDTGWRFQKGESPGAATPAFDDAGWRVLDLPHDWAIEGPFDPAISPHQGSLPFFGVAWYRKRFDVPESARGRYYALEIDGAMSNATVYLNGQELGGRTYGYIGFAARPDAPPSVRRRERPGRPARPRAGVLPLVPRRGTLPARLDRGHRAGARGAVGDVRDDAGRDRGRGDRRRPHRAPQPRDGPRPRRARDGDPGRRGSARSRGRTSSPTVPAGATAAALSRITVPGPARWDVDRPAPLQGDQHREARRRRARPVRDALRHPDDRVRPRQGLPPQRPSRPAEGRVQPPRPRRARRRRQPPRDRAPARDPEAHGRERHPHEPQPAGPGAARGRRPHGLPRHGRGLRHVGHDEGEERPRQVLRRVGRARPAGHDPARPEPPERRDVEHRERDPRAGGGGRLEGGEAPHRHLPRGRPDAARHRRLQPGGERHQEPPGRPGGHPRLQLRRPPVREDPRRAPRLDDRGGGDGLLRQLARGLPPSDREVREAPFAPAHGLRRDRAALGVLPGRRVRRARGLAAGAGRVRVDGLRLPRRADPVLRLGPAPGREGLARAQLLLRDRGPRRVPEGPVLPLPEPVDDEADGARAARTGTGPGSRASPSR